MDKGLTTAEAQSRLERFGLNRVEMHEKKWYLILLEQFKSPMILLLVVAAGISYWNGENTDAIIIFSIILLNSCIGFYQEIKALGNIQKLKNFITTNVNVLRDGEKVSLNKDLLVPDDIIYLKLGDIVPADCFILSCEDLLVDESALTGESTLVRKQINEQKAESFTNGTLYSGCGISLGNVTAQVFKTGKESKFGEITSLSASTNKKIEYEENLKLVTRAFIFVSMVALTIIFVLHILVGKNNDLPSLLLFTIAIAITIIPEALPIVMTLSLSNSAHKLAKEGVITKRISSIEDLGNIEILCTDKTGTLTENKIAVTKFDAIDQDELLELAALSAINSDDPYDKALINYIEANQPTILRKRIPNLVINSPFNPDLKYSQRVYEDITVRKGAAEVVLKECQNINSDEILNLVKQNEAQGLRAISLCKQVDGKHFNYIGTFYFADKVKSDVEETIKLARKAEIQIKVITGDSLEVTQNVCLQIGLITEKSEVIDASMLDFENAEVLHEQVIKYAAFTRTNPIQKYKIIESLERNNHVGYMGDGINDAPSLKLANVSIVVNNASDVAKSSADIILVKEGLEVIIQGIIEGRKVFENIDKYVKHTLIGNFGNFFTIGLVSPFLSYLPILPIQILLSNLLTDIPSLAFSVDNVDASEIKRPKNHNFKFLLGISVLLGIVSSVFDFIFFFIFKSNQPSQIQTMWLVFSTMTEILVIFSLRTKKIFFIAKKPALLLILLSLLSSGLIIVLPLIGVPDLSIEKIDITKILLILLIAYFYFVTTEVIKVIVYKFRKRSSK